MVQCCDITVASLKTLITIERRVRAADGQGGWTESWVADPVGGVWAMATERDGTERFTAMRLESLNMMYFFVRFKGDALGAPYWLATETRIVCRGRVYNVQSIVDVELKKKWLRFMTREGEAA
jgi:SPP1 family predicted phage head-tail adaptor